MQTAVACPCQNRLADLLCYTVLNTLLQAQPYGQQLGCWRSLLTVELSFAGFVSFVLFLVALC